MKQHDDGQKKPAARQQQGIPGPAASDITPPDTLKMQTLARLGLWKNSPPSPPSDDPDKTMKGVPVWQGRVLEIQALTERGKQGDTKAIKQIEAFLGNKYVEVGAAAVRALEELVRVGRIAPQHFFYYLTAPTEVRVLVLLALASMSVKPPPDLLNQFVEEVQNEQEEPSVRIAIIHLLGTLGEQTPDNVLNELLERDPDWMVREAVVNALVALRISMTAHRKRVMDRILTQALYDEDAFVREAALVALRERFPVKAILGDLHASDAGKREKAARILGSSGQATPAVVEGLTNHAVHDTVPAVRKACVLALASLNASIDETTIMTLLKDRDEEVHAAALILEDILLSVPDDEEAGEDEQKT